MSFQKLLKLKKKTDKNPRPIKAGGFQDWISLPIAIKNKKHQLQLGMQQLQNTYILYRAQSLTYEYFATNTDRNLDTLYSWIRKEVNKLATMEADLYFRLFSLRALHALDTHLDDVLNKQKELEKKIQKAPLAFDFYNRMSFFKSRHHKQEQEEREISRILSKARNNLSHALDYFSEYEKEQAKNPAQVSILSLEKAREYWQSKIDEINQMEKENNDPALVVTDMENLTKLIFDTPSLGKWVDAVEKKFKHLSLDHEVLVNAYGKRIIPADIMDEFTDFLYTAIPRLWATGQSEKINQHLTELDAFLSTYQAEVESEIKFAERHGHRETMATEKAIKLNQLSDLARLFITAMDARDPLMKTHSETVAHLAVSLSRHMNWKQEDIQYLEIAALLHDVGKLWIPESILTKKTKLTAEEMDIIRMHPAYGTQILQTSDMFKKIIPWILHHQELWNGTGYPDGLKEEEISIQSRIISLCEGFAAMLTGTSVKTALNVEQAIDRVQMDAGILFDPVLVENLVTVIETQEMEFLKKYVEK